ncbi:hypothetical protein [Bacillus sp. Bva_UNVM-123]
MTKNFIWVHGEKILKIDGVLLVFNNPELLLKIFLLWQVLLPGSEGVR